MKDQRMNKIKIVGALLLILSVVLVLLSNFIASENKENISTLNYINEQKGFTQEISKSIFYTYRNGHKSSENLENTIKKYIENTKVNEIELTPTHIIPTLWNVFYADVQKFRIQHKITTGYNSVITAKLVNRIYHNNVLLVNEFDKLIQSKQLQYHENIDGYKQLQYVLFFILITLLLYLFTQVKVILEFVQKFSTTSKSIIENSTIQGLSPMEEIKRGELKEATQNYNHLVEKINSSIDYSTKAMEQTTKALEEVEQNIEDFIKLLASMNEGESDELFDKEDAVIESLESLMNLRERLTSLKGDLDRLTTNID